ncbi:MAG TPA: methyltransferase domain-containing protein [Pirellulales bacterium]|jgi:phospholipid N-methyltransferase|nr:methyltransferase domain-containing protein [Pirellulales bacterium]
MAKFLADQRVFLKQFWSQYRTTGAIWPSGRSLSRALARFVREGTGPRRILEVGPGTGAVTAEIIRGMNAADRLELVELNDDFVRHLQARFATDALFQTVAERSEIHHAPVEALTADQSYDLIVSGLPLNNFEVVEVDAILNSFRRLLKPGGTISFFEYMAIRKVKACISGSQTRARLRGIAASLDRLFETEVGRDCVFWNITPAWVHHVRLGEMR